MLRNNTYWCWLLMAVLACPVLAAQETVSTPPDGLLPGPVISPDSTVLPVNATRYAVGNIIITGNKRTKAPIILRELPFQAGEEYTLQELVKKFEIARKQLLNTALFHSVIVAAKDFNDHTANVTVVVKERWYLFPFPYFKPVDRNLNQWLFEQNASLSRVNYGAKLLYNNATGNNDKLRMWLIGGYTKQISFSYDRLYIDKKMKWGLKTAFATGKNHELNYNTINDKQVFLKTRDHYVRSFLTTSVELTYRRLIKTRHSLGIGYTRENVLDTIVTLNPSYFKSGRNTIQYPEISYSLSYIDLDYIPYPTKGYAAQLSIGKRGFNNVINMWQLTAKGTGSWHLAPKLFYNLNIFGSIKLPFRQPYFNQRFLGYGDVFMQGFEYYVVDGVAGGYMKSTLTRELFNFGIKLPKLKKGKESERIPVRIFGKIFGNTGYVYNEEPGENELSNKLLYSGGFGIDILTFYDVTFKLEWTFNQLGENGLFLHRKTIF